MIQAVLFDLDDTLLGNPLETFMPRYFTLLGRHAAALMPPGRFLAELQAATVDTIASTDASRTNREVFWASFRARTGLDAADLEPFFDEFYQNEFHQLAAVTQARPEALPLLQACGRRELKLVVATNPLFPLRAIKARLAWAGVPVSLVRYDLVTSYENMHSTKPHASYYREIACLIGCPPGAMLMVGNDWRQDIEPAHRLGMVTFQIVDAVAPAADRPMPPPTARGTLADLLQRVEAGWLTRPTSDAPN